MRMVKFGPISSKFGRAQSAGRDMARKIRTAKWDGTITGISPAFLVHRL
jgi:hypothetical protein